MTDLKTFVQFVLDIDSEVFIFFHLKIYLKVQHAIYLLDNIIMM